MSNNMISITIQASSPGELRSILLGLLGDVSVNVNAAKLQVAGDDPDKTVAKVAEKPKAAAKATTAKPEAKPEPEPSKPTEGEKQAETPATVEAKPEPEPEKPKAKPTTKKAEPKSEEPAGDAPELPDNIKNTNSMRDLLTYLSEHGVDSVDAMVAACTVLKKDVPILSKVPNVEDRVRRALDVLALFTTEEAAQE